MFRHQYGWVLLSLVILCMAACVLSLMLGKFPLSASQVFHSLWAWGSPNTQADLVVWNLRLPRVGAGLLVGAALAGAGAAYQTMFRNPLVSPDILGVSAGAALGAVIGIFLSWSLFGVQLLAFGGGLIAVGLVYGVSLLNRRQDSVLILVLAGVAIGALLGSGIALIKILADPYSQLPSITFWLLGGLNSVHKRELLWALPFLLVGLSVLFGLRWRINLLSLSELEAQALGIHPQRLRTLLIIAATLMTAAAVSFTGLIGWVGLVVPHIARMLVGPSFARLLPTSLVLGAIFLVLTDNVARNLSTVELPLGVVTALIGAPFFLYLLIKGARYER